jgi:sugar phosphate isomerase/epimerase
VILGYNTNGFAFHRLADAIDILADIGYQGVAITLDYFCLNPYDARHIEECERVRAQLERRNLRRVIETGARFLLDPWNKHQPTLVSPAGADRLRRIDFLIRAIQAGNRIGADAVSIWSGRPTDEAPFQVVRERLIASLKDVLRAAEEHNLPLALEPEPGMFIGTAADAETLLETLSHPLLGLTLDIGHLHCQREGDIAAVIRRAAPRLRNVHLADMWVGVHDHLMFGDGDIEFGPVLQVLEQIRYAGGAYVELSRHSHDAVAAARNALQFLRTCRDRQ